MTPKIFIGLLASLLFLSSLVSAGIFPQPVAGTVSLPGYSTLAGLDLEQKNIRTGLTYVVQLDDNGFYLLDWGNLPYLDGDTIEIAIKVCKERPECRSTTRIYDGEPSFVILQVPSSFSVIQEVKTVYQCADGSQVNALTDCPLPLPVEKVIEVTKEIIVEKEVQKEVIKEVEVSRYYCADGKLSDDPNACLDSKDRVKKYIAGFGVGIVASGFAALVAWYVRRGKRATAEKMVKTRIENLKKKK